MIPGVVAGLPATPPPVSDPFFANVAVLLHFDGTPADVTTTDSSSNGFTVTVVGTSEISNTQAKFVTSTSVPADQCGWAIADDPALELGNGDWTIEGWFYPTLGTGGDQVLLCKWATGAISWLLVWNPTTPQMYFGRNTNAGANFPTQAGGLTVNTWNHVAVSRDGANVRIFVNGVGLAGNPTNIGVETFDNNASPFSVGHIPANPGTGFRGFVDDVRLTVGVARYTANFTPPVAAFPNF